VQRFAELLASAAMREELREIGFVVGDAELR
jgi:hypothetical protein